MFKYKMYGLFTTFLMLIIFMLPGCVSGEDTGIKQDIKGKFAFYSSRSIKEKYGHWGIYVAEKGKVKKIFDQAGAPQWSKDGERIACVQGDLVISVLDKTGKLLETYPETKGAVSLAWSPDNTKFVYTTRSPLGAKVANNDLIYLYDTVTGEKRKLVDFEGKAHAGEISFSPKGDKILFTKVDSKDIKNGGVYIYDFNNNELQLVRAQVHSPSWYPDGKHILVTTNRNDDWSMINDKLGVFMKINIETGERTVLGDKTRFYSTLKLSKDGKYIYYESQTGGGKAIFIAPLDDPENEIQVTKPIERAPGKMSHDTAPDWYEGAD